MPTKHLKAPLVFALSLFLTGCLSSDGKTSAQKGFFGGGQPFSKRTAEGQRKTSLAGGDVKLKAPDGYCVDPSTESDQSFALLVDCAVLAESASDAPQNRGLITVSASPAFPGGADLANVSEKIGQVTQTFRSDSGALVLKVDEGGDRAIAGASPEFWRGVMTVNERAVTVAVYAPIDGALAGDAGRAILTSVMANISKASPKKPFPSLVAAKSVQNPQSVQ